MIKIQESEMSFGEFQEENLFHIEKSKIYKNLGDGIKTVEFILRYDEKSIVFLEAKKSIHDCVMFQQFECFCNFTFYLTVFIFIQ